MGGGTREVEREGEGRSEEEEAEEGADEEEDEDEVEVEEERGRAAVPVAAVELAVEPQLPRLGCCLPRCAEGEREREREHERGREGERLSPESDQLNSKTCSHSANARGALSANCALTSFTDLFSTRGRMKPSMYLASLPMSFLVLSTTLLSAACCR
jgi:hypothetical protein